MYLLLNLKVLRFNSQQISMTLVVNPLLVLKLSVCKHFANMVHLAGVLFEGRTGADYLATVLCEWKTGNDYDLHMNHVYPASQDGTCNIQLGNVYDEFLARRDLTEFCRKALLCGLG
jgi:hypothetical protein